jgi:hypothetical protein
LGGTREEVEKGNKEGKTAGGKFTDDDKLGEKKQDG